MPEDRLRWLESRSGSTIEKYLTVVQGRTNAIPRATEEIKSLLNHLNSLRGAMSTPPIPATPDALTAEWMQYALSHGRLDDVAVASIRVSEVPGATGVTGSYATVSIEYGPGSGNGPATVFAKQTTKPILYEVAGDVFEREAAAYHAIDSGDWFRMPKFYFGASSLEDNAAILLIEDFASVETGDSTGSPDHKRLELAVTALARFHARWWNSLDLDSFDWLWKPPTAPRFLDAPLLGFVEQHLDDIIGPEFDLSESTRTIGRKVAAAPHLVWQRLLAGDRTLVHNDFRLENMFFDSAGGDARPIVFDWGVVTTMSGMFDLASFVVCTDEPKDTAEALRWLDLYCDVLDDKGVSYSRKALDVEYAIAASACLGRRLWGIADTYLRDVSEHAVSMRKRQLERVVRHIELLDMHPILEL